ncbi:MAG: rhomboid family intramembrane serine protease [Vulcanimicrobiaceae bacterium]
MIPIGDEDRPPVFPIAVYALVAINVLVFVVELGSANPTHFVDSFAMIPYDVTHGITLAPPSPPPLLTLITAQFLHGSILHIGFNMLFLLVFGPDVEYLCGHRRFVAFYLFCGLVGNVAQITIGPASHVPALGASGAIAGVLGAYIVNFPRNEIRTIIPIGFFPLFFRIPAVLVIGLWIVTQVINGVGSISPQLAQSQGGTAYFAHIGGFACGVLAIGLFRVRRARVRDYRYYF